MTIEILQSNVIYDFKKYSCYNRNEKQEFKEV